MNLSQLRYFRKLAQVQHFTKAAEDLYITQPALSNAIKKLEEELGIPLFEQQGRNVRLSKYGREFNRYICEGLDIIDKGVQTAQEHANSMSGAIDVGTIFTVQSDYLPQLLNEYRTQYGTQVEIKLYQGLSQGLIENLENGLYDLAICAYVENKPNLQFVPILYQDLVLVVDGSHEFASRTSVSLDDLKGSKIVTYRPETPVGREVGELLKQHNLMVEQWCDDEITLGSMVVANTDLVGLSLDTLGLAPFKQLKTISLEGVERGFHPVFLVYRKNSYKSRAVENMITLAAKRAEDELRKVTKQSQGRP